MQQKRKKNCKGERYEQRPVRESQIMRCMSAERTKIGRLHSSYVRDITELVNTVKCELETMPKIQRSSKKGDAFSFFCVTSG